MKIPVFRSQQKAVEWAKTKKRGVWIVYCIGRGFIRFWRDELHRLCWTVNPR